MQNLLLSLFVDGLMALLLVVTIFYCYKLNLRIRALQDGRSELADIIREFDESTKRAAQGIAEIHLATQRISENMQHKIDKANFLADDLQYLIERGNKLADKIDPSSASARQAATARQTVAAARPAPSAPVKEAPKAAETALAPSERRGLRMRSRAEQELMDVIKTSGNES